MKAGESTLQQLVGGLRQSVMPVFQRYYTWDKKNWQQLWEDVFGLLDTSPADSERRHFFGAIVTIKHPPTPSGLQRVLVIDGQQRLTTLSLLLCAIRDAARHRGWSRVAEKLHGQYLEFPFQEDENRYRLFPRMRDRKDYFDLVDAKRVESKSRVSQGYEYFVNEINRSKNDLLVSEKQVEALIRIVTTRLDFVAVELDAENPYAIFQSLNSTGLALEQSDLIRNHVFMELGADEEERFDTDNWQVLENHFAERRGSPSSAELADFFRACLMRRGNYVSEKGVFERFRDEFKPGKFDPRRVVEEFLPLARYYDIVRGERVHPEPCVERALQDVRELSLVSVTPLVLRLIEMRATKALTDDELIAALRAIASFVVRRAIMGETTRFLGAWFCTACKVLDTDPVGNLRAFLIEKNWPNDSLVMPKLQEFDLHKSKMGKAILVGMERWLRDREEPVLLPECNVHFILPQRLNTDDVSNEWRHDLGINSNDLHSTWTNRAANLTLVEANVDPPLEGLPFAKKRTRLSTTSFKLNAYFRKDDLHTWNEAAMKARGVELSRLACEVWRGP